MTHSVGIYITQWNDGGNQHQRLVGSFTQPMESSLNSNADRAPDISAARCEAQLRRVGRHAGGWMRASCWAAAAVFVCFVLLCPKVMTISSLTQKELNNGSF